MYPALKFVDDSLRLLTKPFSSSCQKCDSDKIETVENLYTIYSVEMIKFALQRIWSLEVC